MVKLLGSVRATLSGCRIRSLARRIAVSGALVFASAGMAQESELAVSITPAENGVEFVLTNTSDSPLRLLRWETPLESELTQDMFVITESDGANPSVYAKRATFSGRLFKRPNPLPSDFIDIEAGQSVSAVVNLADHYQLDVEGSHQVRFNGVLRIQGQEEALAQSLALLRSRSVLAGHQHHFYDGLDAIPVSTAPIGVELTPVPEVLYARAAGYSGCTATQQQELLGDFDASETITREARQALEGLPVNERAGSPRYLHWFGTYSAERYASVLDTYVKAEALMDAEEVEFVCDCQEPYFAFIRRTEPYKVNLCTYYWSAARLGTDSRAGTILHEVSHFNEIGGTSDFAYGAADVSALARNNPNNAVANADSIEYFAENTPFRELSAGVSTPEEPVEIEFTNLVFGNSLPRTVDLQEFDNYRVTNASEIIITTESGDADLFVYSDSNFENLICSSENLSSVDSCEITTSGTVYIRVFGYQQSNYSIVANVETLALQAEQTRSSSLSAGEWELYTVTSASIVEVDSTSGDADLYVYSSAEFDADSLICDSRNSSAFSTIDSCEISGTVYVGVYGTQASQYTISALENEPPVQVIDDGETTDVTDVNDIGTDGTVVTPQSVGDSSGGSGGSGPVGPGMLMMLLAMFGARFQSRLSLSESAK